MQIPEPASEYKKPSFAEIYDVLQSLRKDKILCDIKLETDDGEVIFGHKVVLASASPYFHDKFTHNSKKDRVAIKELDSSALHLLIDFIYSGKIILTERNVQVLLPASKRLKLYEVEEACFKFLQTQLSPTHFIGIITIADFHKCTTLLTSSEFYLKQHFSDVVEGEEFLSLSSEQMIKLIASEELIVSSEEKIYESVIRWVKHDLDSRKQVLPILMKHVRLPLISIDYFLNNVVKESLLVNCSICTEYLKETFNFNLLKAGERIRIPHNIRPKPIQPDGTHQVILVIGGREINDKILDSTEWYDPKINQWQPGPKMIRPFCAGGLAVVNDNFVLCLGGRNTESTLGCISASTIQSAYGLDLSKDSPNWRQTHDMLVKRQWFGVGVINYCIYAVGGCDGKNYLNSAEVFNCRTQKWSMISSMSTTRFGVGLGVLNNLLYAVGGLSPDTTNSVECYDPEQNKWTPIADMCVRRSGMGVGVLNGVLYAIGGSEGLTVHRSVEAYRPSTSVWSPIPDMHKCRYSAGVAVLNGLLYVVGGINEKSVLDSVEYYDPQTNTWTMITASMNIARSFAGAVAVDVPRDFKAC